LTGTTLERSNVECSAASDDFVPFVQDVQAISISWRCSNPDYVAKKDPSVSDPADKAAQCYVQDDNLELASFPRMAVVMIDSLAANPQDVRSSIQLSALTPNLRE
jgi:hypothetical protein